MSDLFTLELEVREDVVVARLSGELDVTGSDHAGELLAGGVRTSARGLLVDLSELAFIDSSGVAMLFALARRLHGRRQALRVVARPGTTVERVLEIVELRRAAPVLGGLEEALADMG
ncbi:MAG: STAS domain-containing protein [Nocardioidaceae bacterium]